MNIATILYNESANDKIKIYKSTQFTYYCYFYMDICVHTQIHTQLNRFLWKFVPSFTENHKHPLEDTKDKKQALNKMKVN